MTDGSSSPLLSIHDLRIYFRSRGQWIYAVDGIDLSIQAGEGVAIIGESGSGKTLTMLSTLGLISGNPGIVSGQILYHDGSLRQDLLAGVADVFSVAPDRSLQTRRSPEIWQTSIRQRASLLAGRKIGIIFQNPITSQDPLWSIGQTLAESVRLRDPSLSKKAAHDEALEWLKRVHIKRPEQVMKAYPHQLSGGMCQRVMIASTLALRPRILIADEPTTGLDMTTKAQVLSLLREARERDKATLIFVTHEIGLVTGLTDRIVVMHKGKIADSFPTSALQETKLSDDRLSIETSYPFADYTKRLLHASLQIEEPRHLIRSPALPSPPAGQPS